MAWLKKTADKLRKKLMAKRAPKSATKPAQPKGPFDGVVNLGENFIIPHGRAKSYLPILRIGLEHERMLFKGEEHAHVKGMAQEEAPHDALTCLAETRGLPSTDWLRAANYLLEEQANVDSLYAKLDLTPRQGEYLISKKLHRLALDNALKSDESYTCPNYYRGGGLHIHFSATYPDGTQYRISHALRLIMLRKLDDQLRAYVVGKSFYRRFGQYRVKDYGFEYRSCYWDGNEIDLYAMAMIAYQIFQEAMIADRNAD